MARRLIALLGFTALMAVSALADDTAALTVEVHDGGVFFEGRELDIDQLQSQLSASGRQDMKVYIRIRSTAKTVYVDRVIAAIHAAGFATIAILGPGGQEKVLDPPV